MQHYISRHDNQDEPDMNRTLDLAIAWERRHGTNYKVEKIREVNAYSSGPGDTTDWRSSEESGEAEVNKINYVPVREMTTEEGRKLAKQNNELVALMRKQAYAVLEEDKRATVVFIIPRSIISTKTERTLEPLIQLLVETEALQVTGQEVNRSTGVARTGEAQEEWRSQSKEVKGQTLQKEE